MGYIIRTTNELGLRTNHAAEFRNARKPDGDRDVHHAGAQERHHQKGEQHAGESRQHVEHAADRLVDHPVVQPGEHAEKHAAGDTDQHRTDADQQRIAGAVDHPGQHIPSQPVGAKPMGGAGRMQALQEVPAQRVIRADRSGRHDRDRQQQNECQRRQHGGGNRQPPWR